MTAESPIFDLLLRGAVLIDGSRTDIGVRSGHIAALGPDLSGHSARTLDLDGRLVMPGLIEAHTHLDKALTVASALNQSGTLAEAIARMHEVQRRATSVQIYERALATARMFILHGVTTLRTHVDVTEATDLRAVEALLRVREALRGQLDLQLVSLSMPLVGAAGAHNRALVEEALRMGVDAVGGVPVLESDLRVQIDTVFALACAFDRPIDLHVDESDDPRDFSLSYLAEKTIAEGYQGRVVASHCCALSAVTEQQAAHAIERVCEAQIAVVTLPSANMYLLGRADNGMVRRGLTRVRQLLDAGVPVCCGSDNVQDPFNPFGRGDLLLVANLLAHAAHLGSPGEQQCALDAITSTPARVLGLEGYGLKPGCAADLVVLDTTEPQGLLATVPPRRYVIKAGTVVAETRTDYWLQGQCAGTAG